MNNRRRRMRNLRKTEGMPACAIALARLSPRRNNTMLSRKRPLRTPRKHMLSPRRSNRFKYSAHTLTRSPMGR